MKVENTFIATIHLGLKNTITSEIRGIEEVEKVCQSVVDEDGECINIMPCKYIYTKGNETGARIEFIQYPRFPRSEQIIIDRAINLAQILMETFNQYKVTVVTLNKTYMLENDKLEIRK